MDEVVCGQETDMDLSAIMNASDPLEPLAPSKPSYPSDPSDPSDPLAPIPFDPAQELEASEFDEPPPKLSNEDASKRRVLINQIRLFLTNFPEETEGIEIEEIKRLYDLEELEERYKQVELMVCAANAVDDVKGIGMAATAGVEKAGCGMGFQIQGLTQVVAMNDRLQKKLTIAGIKYSGKMSTDPVIGFVMGVVNAGMALHSLHSQQAPAAPAAPTASTASTAPVVTLPTLKKEYRDL